MERLITKYNEENVPKEICTIDRFGEADDCSSCAEICEECNSDCENCAIQKCFNKLADYEDAEEQGLLLRTQVAIGQTVFTNTTVQGWYMRKSKRPYEATVVYIGINGVDNYMNVDFKDGYMLSFPFSQIGKTVFLTKEEAEKALADMGGVRCE